MVGLLEYHRKMLREQQRETALLLSNTRLLISYFVTIYCLFFILWAAPIILILHLKIDDLAPIDIALIICSTQVIVILFFGLGYDIIFRNKHRNGG